MSPPIYTPDGTEVSEIVLPDGSTASQVIGPDGNVVFEAGPDIPDSGMFQSPLYQYTAVAGLGVSDGATADNWTEQLAGAGDATAVGGPIYRADQAGFDAVEYDGADGGHDWPSDGNLPTGANSVTFAATIYVKNPNRGTICRYGNASSLQRIRLDVDSNNTVIVDLFGASGASAQGGSYSTGSWITVGGVLTSGGAVEAFLNGASVASASDSAPDLIDQDRRVGYNASGDAHFDGYIYDVVICDAAESAQAFSDYHDDRIQP